jgi:hypothetical protein
MELFQRFLNAYKQKENSLFPTQKQRKKPDVQLAQPNVTKTNNPLILNKDS